jgi:hypothetical protein
MEQRRIFCFGSNRRGQHGKGAALEARQKYGAVYGQADGLQGNSYAIVTKELRKDEDPVTITEVRQNVQRFLNFASRHPEWIFDVTPVGCGLAGHDPQQILPMFELAVDNVNGAGMNNLNLLWKTGKLNPTENWNLF